MNLEQERTQRINHIIDQIASRDKAYLNDLQDLLLWAFYGQETLSQFGLGLKGWVFRQRYGSTVMTVKVTEEGVPLVGFVTAATTRGCIEQMFDLLYAGRMTWQKDKYPWI